MAKKIGGMILAVLGLFSAFLGIKVVSSAPVQKEIVENAVYVADGKILSENEGKVVIVTGTLEAPLPFVDEETGIELNSIVAYRRVEKARVELGSDDEEDTWTWVSVTDERDLGGSGKVVAPGVTIGEFAVADELLNPVPTLIERDQYSAAELSAGGWDTFRDQGRTYLYGLDYMPLEDDTVHYDSALRDYMTSQQKNEGTLRVRYNVMADDASLEYTIIGLQKNGRLEEVDELGVTMTTSGHLTAEEMLEKAESSSTGATVFYFAAAAVLMGLGIWKIVKASQPAKPAQQNKSKKRV